MSKPRQTTLPLSLLIEDMEVYPRHAVDSAHVASLVRALRAGATLPPIVADEKTKIIVDGWHRCRAHNTVSGPTAVVDVELIAYRNQAAMLLDAVQRNSAHGRRFDRIDEARAVVLLERLNVEIVRIAVALNCPQEHVEKLSLRLAEAPVESSNTITGTATIALKRPVRHLAGQTLTREQAEVHSSLPGTSFLLIAKQLRGALRERMVDLTDRRLVEELRLLFVELRKVVEPPK
jgi:hypothetical protein